MEKWREQTGEGGEKEKQSGDSALGFCYGVTPTLRAPPYMEELARIGLMSQGRVLTYAEGRWFFVP